MTVYDRFGDRLPHEDEYIFALLNKAYGPKPRKIHMLAKAIPADRVKSMLPKKPRLILPVKKAEPSDRELLGALSHACALGLLSGHDALACEIKLAKGEPLPADIRKLLLRYA